MYCKGDKCLEGEEVQFLLTLELAVVPLWCGGGVQCVDSSLQWYEVNRPWNWIIRVILSVCEGHSLTGQLLCNSG